MPIFSTETIYMFKVVLNWNADAVDDRKFAKNAFRYTASLICLRFCLIFSYQKIKNVAQTLHDTFRLLLRASVLQTFSRKSKSQILFTLVKCRGSLL